MRKAFWWLVVLVVMVLIGCGDEPPDDPFTRHKATCPTCRDGSRILCDQGVKAMQKTMIEECKR